MVTHEHRESVLECGLADRFVKRVGRTDPKADPMIQLPTDSVHHRFEFPICGELNLWENLFSQNFRSYHLQQSAVRRHTPRRCRAKKQVSAQLFHERGCSPLQSSDERIESPLPTVISTVSVGLSISQSFVQQRFNFLRRGNNPLQKVKASTSQAPLSHQKQQRLRCPVTRHDIRDPRNYQFFTRQSLANFNGFVRRHDALQVASTDWRNFGISIAGWRINSGSICRNRINNSSRWTISRSIICSTSPRSRR